MLLHWTGDVCKYSFVKFRDKLGLLPNPFLLEGVLEIGNKEGLLALHVSLHARKTLNRKPNVFNVILLSLDLGKYIN